MKKSRSKKQSELLCAHPRYIIGFAYEIYPPFMDKRGLFIELCRKIFVSGTNLNISFELPTGIQIRSMNPPIEVVFQPTKTVISQIKSFPKGKFKECVAKFYTYMKDFYASCNLHYVGGVVETICETNTKQLKLVTPTANKQYRYNLSIRTEKSTKCRYTITIDTQKISALSLEDITKIIDESKTELDRFLAAA